MYPVYEWFKTACLTAPGVKQVEAWIEVIPPGASNFVAQISSGSVTQDADAAITRTASVELTGFSGLEYDIETIGANQTFGSGTFGAGYFGGYATRVIRGLFMPLKTRFKVWEKYHFSSGVQVVQHGEFYLTNLEFVDGANSSSMRVEGFDVLGMLSKSRLRKAMQLEGNLTVDEAVYFWIERHLPMAWQDVATTSRLLGQTATYLAIDDLDPVTVLNDLAGVAGWDVWANRLNAINVKVPPDRVGSPTVQHVFTPEHVNEFQLVPDGLDVVNTMIVVGATAKGSDNPVVGTATLASAHPYSVASMGQTLGKVEQNDLMKSVPAVTDAADKALRKYSAISEALVVKSAAQIPWLDVSDVVGAESEGLDLDAPNWSIRGIDYPLGIGTPTFRLSRVVA